MDPQIPKTLCHPDGKKSCGACCGMYNHRDADRGSTDGRIAARTIAFGRHQGTLADFREAHEPGASDKLLVALRNCPFLGRVDGGCVGCMLHPLQNDGRDDRDAGVYHDREVCDGYLCAAHEILRPMEKWLVVAAIEDSYTYGLVVTDPLFVRQLFERAADLNGSYPLPQRVRRPAVVDAARAYFALKADWPHRAPDGVFGQVVAGEGLDTPRRACPAEQLGATPAPWDAILRCLGTSVDTISELDAARRVVETSVREFARALERPG